MEARALESKVEAVTVYTRGARVERTAELARNGDPYPAAIRLTGLPLSLQDDSVRVAVEPIGDGDAPVATDVRVALEVPEPDESLRPATADELKEARRAERRLEDRIAQLRRELQRLSLLELVDRPPGADGEPPRPSPTEARLALIELRAEASRALQSEMRTLQRDYDRARRRRQDLEERDATATSARRAEEHELRKSVIVSLTGIDAGAGSARLRLEYQVPGARWAPAYALRLDRSMTRGRLAMRAVVGQKTGEDWSDAELTLSTAEMQRWTELPELTSIRVGRAQPPAPKAGWRPPPPDTDELYSDWDRCFRSRLYGAPPPAAPASAPMMLDEAEPVDAGYDEFDEVTAVAGPASDTGSFAVDEMLSMEEEARSRVREVQRSMAPAPAKRGGILGNLLGGLGGAPGGPPPAPPPPQKTVMLGAPSAAAPMEPAPVLGEPTVGRDLLAYGELRMPPASEPGRGKLVVASRRELYLQLLVEQEIRIEVDVLGAVARAERAAGELVDDSLPAGCHYAWSRFYDYAYRAAARVDVPSDGSFHAVPLADADAEVRRRYVVVPRESTDVFRTASLINPLDAPLLAGPVDIYLADDFLLTSDVDFTAAGGKVDLGLGVEQGIKVARNTRYREETSGLMGGSLELHHQILIDLRNNLDQSAPIEVRERLPTVRDDDEDEIKVTVGKVSPAWEPYQQSPDSASEDELDGGRRWQLEVPAGGSESLRVEYAVKISSKHELVGGNRREG